MMRDTGLAATAAVLAMLWAAPSRAAELPGVLVPQPARINEIEDTLRRPGQRGPDAGKGETLLDTLKLDESAKPKAENQTNAPSFTLQTLKVIGNTVLQESVLADQVRGYVGKSVTAGDLQEMAVKITKLYADRGYVTSRCIVPPQRVEDGSVVLQIEEDKLGSVLLAGASSYRYEAKVFFDQLIDLRGKVLNAQELEARLRLVARIPGARVKPTLKKSSFGLTDLVLEVTELDDTGTVALSNDGNRFTSKNRLTVSKTLNNVTGTGDVLTLSALGSVPNPQLFGGYTLNYQRPVGTNGGRLMFNSSALYYRLDPAETGNNAIRYEGGSQFYEVQYERPVDLERYKLGTPLWFFGFERRDATAATVYNTIFDHPAGYRYVDGHDKITAISTGLKFERFDDWWGYRGQSQVNLSVKRALPGWFGSMDSDSIANKIENMAARVEPVLGPIGDVRGMSTNFLKFYVSATRSQTLPLSIILQATVAAEYTSAKRIPQSYDFTGADNGASGLRLTVAATRPFGSSGLVVGAGFTQANAISYYRDLAGGGTPGCQKALGVFSANSIDRNVCSAGNIFFTLGYRDKNMFGDVIVNGPQPAYMGAQVVRVNTGMYW